MDSNRRDSTRVAVATAPPCPRSNPNRRRQKRRGQPADEPRHRTGKQSSLTARALEVRCGLERVLAVFPRGYSARTKPETFAKRTRWWFHSHRFIPALFGLKFRRSASLFPPKNLTKLKSSSRTNHARTSPRSATTHPML